MPLPFRRPQACLAMLLLWGAATAQAQSLRQLYEAALGYDATLFAGPAWNPAWPDSFARSVAPITALTADHARPSLARNAFERAPDPAQFATDTFAGFLAGIPVLTIAAPKHLEAWRRFTGGLGEELPPRVSALQSWFSLAIDMQKSQTAMEWEER